MQGNKNSTVETDGSRKRTFLLLSLAFVILAVLIYYLFIFISIYRDPVQLSLLKIPSHELYYYYDGQKMFLNRHLGVKGIYFTGKDSHNQIFYKQELFVGFKPNISEKEIESFLYSENLAVVRRSDLLPITYLYLVTTTPSSRYINSLQMANYLQASYPHLIEYSSPNSRQYIDIMP